MALTRRKRRAHIRSGLQRVLAQPLVFAQAPSIGATFEALTRISELFSRVALHLGDEGPVPDYIKLGPRGEDELDREH